MIQAAPDDYRIERVTLAGCPPIGNLYLRFGPNLNVIVEDSGLGKTTLARALCTRVCQYGGGIAIRGSGNPKILEENRTNALIDDLFFRASGADRPIDHWTRLCHDNPALCLRVSVALSEATRGKLRDVNDTFDDIPYRGPDTFAIDVDADGVVTVSAGPALRAVSHSSPYGSVESSFLPIGDNFLINLLGVLAAREHLGLHCPLILDGVLGALDSSLLERVVTLLHTQGSQVIIFTDSAGLATLKGLLDLDDAILRM